MSFLAQIAHAQGTFSKVGSNPAVNSIVSKIVSNIVAPLVYGLFFLTMLIFVWGVFGLISKGDDPTARKEGQRHILWGVIGMLIMVSVYGIIRLIASTVGGTDPFSWYLSSNHK